MGRLDLNRRCRGQLAWCLAGFLLVQGGLAVGVDRFWPTVRDPEFCERMTRLKNRHAEAPHRPLILAFGSSHMEMGLDAANLSRSSDPNADPAPLVFNFGLPGGGPMLQSVCLERLLQQAVRPDGLFIEIAPTGLSERTDRPAEESFLDPARLCWTEVSRLMPAYYERPDLGWPRWLLARLAPTYRYQAELRTPLGVDVYRDPDAHPDWDQPDAYGWRAFRQEQTPEQRAAKTAYALGQYRPKLANFRLSPGADRALRDLLERCRQERIPTGLVLTPESSRFRALYTPETLAAVDAYVHALAAAYDFPLIDGRLWVADDGFWDGHHLNSKGAAVFTERFRLEALQPLLRRQGSTVPKTPEVPASASPTPEGS